MIVDDRTARGGDATRDGRLRFLDVARALAVLAMLAANLMNVIPADHPRWLAHNVGDELLPFDLPAPIFQFLIGVSLVLFLTRRRARAGRRAGDPAGDRGSDDRAARLLAARRFLLLIAIGAVLDGILAERVEFRWGVLQTLGAGGLLTVAVAELPDLVVLGLAAVITATHYGPANREVHQSLVGCVPFLPITLVGWVVGRPLATADVARFERRAVLAAIGSLVLALVLHALGVPFNKVTGSSSFVLVAIAASATLVAALSRLERRGRRFPDVLVRLGGSALTAWVLLYLLVYYPVHLGLGHELALPEPSGMVAVAFCVVALSAVTLALARRGIRVPI